MATVLGLVPDVASTAGSLLPLLSTFQHCSTRRSPAKFEGNVGFAPVASGRLRDMLLMRDVNRPSP